MHVQLDTHQHWWPRQASIQQVGAHWQLLEYGVMFVSSQCCRTPSAADRLQKFTAVFHPLDGMPAVECFSTGTRHALLFCWPTARIRLCRG
jgi:hypothetical protein